MSVTLLIQQEAGRLWYSRSIYFQNGLNNTWDWLEKDLTLVTIPEKLQQDVSEKVSKVMKVWLLQDELYKPKD